MIRRAFLRMLGLAPVGLPAVVASCGQTPAVASVESEVARYGRPPAVVQREIVDAIVTAGVDVQRDPVALAMISRDWSGVTHRMVVASTPLKGAP